MHFATSTCRLRSSYNSPFSRQAIDSFLSEAQSSLSVRPQTVEEIGSLNQRHTQIGKRKPEVGGAVRMDVHCAAESDTSSCIAGAFTRSILSLWVYW